jgi:putative ABC transport system ATP-binding protein
MTNAQVSIAAISLRDVAFTWPRQARRCLDIEWFEVAAGERVFLHGPSGSGKSTLLGVLGGVLLPQQGKVGVGGTALDSLSGAQRDRFRADHIGFLFQQFNLLPYLSVLDNVLLACSFSARRRARAEATGGGMHAEALRLFEHLEIDAELQRRPVSELSVGQQQRVAAARALIGRPEIVIADEPTSALDAARQRGFIDLLLRECAAVGATLMFVSHDQRLAEYFDRTVALTAINRMAPTESAA